LSANCLDIVSIVLRFSVLVLCASLLLTATFASILLLFYTDTCVIIIIIIIAFPLIKVCLFYLSLLSADLFPVTN